VDGRYGQHTDRVNFHAAGSGIGPIIRGQLREFGDSISLIDLRQQHPVLGFLHSSKRVHSSFRACPVEYRKRRVIGVATRMMKNPIWGTRMLPERKAPTLRDNVRPTRQPTVSADARESPTSQIDASQWLHERNQG
jgi:hypothetical protein